jgi:hypothetical protein
MELVLEEVTITASAGETLQPETSDSFEVAYVTMRGGLFVQAFAYRAAYADKVFRVPYERWRCETQGQRRDVWCHSEAWRRIQQRDRMRASYWILHFVQNDKTRPIIL